MNDPIVNNNLEDLYIYNGISMHPTFKPGQLIYIQPSIGDLSVGDVIVFFEPVRQIKIVHRVIKIEDGEVYTRGDNNLRNDLNPIPPENILGIVTVADQNGSIHPITGGKAGLRQLRRLTIKKSLIHKVTRLLYPGYKLIKATKLVSIFWRPSIHKVYFQIDDRELFKYVHQGRTVAIWDPNIGRFDCDFPYNLVLDVPQPKST